MIIQEIHDIEMFLYYLNQKNDSMDPPMWKKEEITLAHFNKVYSTFQMFLVKADNSVDVIGGFLLLENDYSYWNEEENKKNCYYIHKLFILPEYNKKGYSPQIIEWIKQLGKKNNKSSIRLDSRSYLIRLNQYYENLGFKVQRKMISQYSGEMNLRELEIK